jgi:hypothetical protein
MIASKALRLLKQDNTIPGNRKDGFRYHHLLFIIIVTPFYLWLELAFGVRLLDVMGTQVRIQDTEAIGHAGRLISGAALALLLLAGWFRQAEKKNLSWARTLGVASCICIVALFATWHIQELVLEFYVKRSQAELTGSLIALAALIALGYWLFRLWVRKLADVKSARVRYLWLAVGAVALIALAFGQSQWRRQLDHDRQARLGFERQQTATLTLIRRGLQEGLVTLPDGDLPAATLASAEGKAYLALFPIFGLMYEQDRFAQERPRLIAEFMYRDWDAEFGQQAFAGFEQVSETLQRFYRDDYQGKHSVAMLGRERVPLGLSEAAFYAHPSVRRYLRTELACFDCAYTVGMSREEFGRALFAGSKAAQVQQAVDLFADPERFASGEFGDIAARTYWAPMLVLLFSMLGVFVHVFRLIVTVSDYRHRVSFSRIGAADSPLANDVRRNSMQVAAVSVMLLALFTYFSDNRITGEESYVDNRHRLWMERPIVGAIAAHWTVNAQGFLYPFTKKIRPEWLTFDTDPMPHIPVVRYWFVESV